MYAALRCKGCGEEHPIREMPREDIIRLMLAATEGKMHEFASNRLSSREWFMIFAVELVLRSRRST